MAGTGFLRTVNFGGFDKKDVLAYVDELNSKIYNLENELKEKNEFIQSLGETTPTFEGAERYESIIAENKAKISELMGNIDTLKLEVSNLENELVEKNNEISKLKEERVMLEEKLESAKSGTSSITEASFDIGSVFIEAKHSADNIITQAKNAAKKIEEDSKSLSQQIIDEANAKAEEIINNAQITFNKTIADANEQAAIILDGANRTKQSIVASYELVAADIEKLANCLNDIVSNGVLKLTDAKQLIEERKNMVNAEMQASINDIEAEKKNNPINTKIVYKFDETSENVENNEIIENVESNITEESAPQAEEIAQEPVVEETSIESNNDYVDTSSETVADISNESAEEAQVETEKKLNIDLDLLAGLTAEVESTYGAGYSSGSDSYISLTEPEENKITLLEDL